MKSGEANTAAIRNVSIGAICNRCFAPVVVVMATTGGSGHTETGARLSLYLQQSFDCSQQHFAIRKTWPQPDPARIPEHLDQRVIRALSQAESNFAISGNEEAAGMMYRRALEVALDLAFPDVEGMLFAKIKALVKTGNLLPAIGAWADAVRTLGNDAAHEAEGLTRSDLIAMREFTDAVLRYAVSLPAEIEARKRTTAPKGGTATPIAAKA